MPLTPPMKPILPVVDLSAAATPTRYEPCSSLNTRPAALGAIGAGGVDVEVQHRVVDDREQHVGVLDGDAAHVPSRGRGRVRGEREADADHEVGVLGLQLQVGAASRGVGGRELVDGDAEVGLGAVHAGGRRVVERLVAAAEQVERQADRDVGAVAAGLAAAVVPGAAVVAAGAAVVAAAGASVVAAGAGVVVVIVTTGRQGQRGDDTCCKQALAHDHVSPFSGTKSGLFTRSR